MTGLDWMLVTETLKIERCVVQNGTLFFLTFCSSLMCCFVTFSKFTFLLSVSVCCVGQCFTERILIWAERGHLNDNC